MYNQLNTIVTTLEMIYNLYDTVTDGCLISLDLETVANEIRHRVSSATEKEKNQVNAEAGKQIVLLSYLTEKICYYDVSVLDYKHYDITIADILDSFTSAERTTTEAVKRLGKLITTITTKDTNDLSYRMFRIFVVMVLWENYFNASVVAYCILQHLEDRNG